MITSWIARGMQNFVAIGLGVSASQIRDFAVPFDVTSFYVRFFGFFNKATACTSKQIFYAKYFKRRRSR